MEELKSPDKKGISTKRKIGKITYAPIIILYSMKIKEQSRKLAVGSTWVRQGEADVVWRDFRRVLKQNNPSLVEPN